MNDKPKANPALQEFSISDLIEEIASRVPTAVFAAHVPSGADLETHTYCWAANADHSVGLADYLLFRVKKFARQKSQLNQSEDEIDET